MAETTVNPRLGIIWKKGSLDRGRYDINIEKCFRGYDEIYDISIIKKTGEGDRIIKRIIEKEDIYGFYGCSLINGKYKLYPLNIGTVKNIREVRKTRFPGEESTTSYIIETV